MSKIIATIPAGGNREGVIWDAIRSVLGFVDAVLLINSGKSAKKAIKLVQRKLDQSKCALHIVDYDCGERFDTATARNLGLKTAAELGYDYALMLDTDERVDAGTVDVRAEVERIGSDIVLVQNHTDEYPKARFIKLPPVGQYQDRAHEIYVGSGTLGLLRGVTFSEVAKTKAEQDALQSRLKITCEQWTWDEPEYSRPWLHLANCHVYAGDHRKAADCFLRSAELNNALEEKAWAMYRAAIELGELGEYEDAIRVAALGMVACPYFPELPYVAAFASAKLDRHFDALGWANVCISLGKVSSVPVVTPVRLGFNSPSVHYEAPWKLRAAILEAMGLTGLAKHAREQEEKALRRESKRIVVGDGGADG